jgi:cysteine synthase B
MTPFRQGPAPTRPEALVGRTPLVRLRRIGADLPGVRIYAKCEFMNPGGSVKDRPALRMIQDAIASGRFGRERVLIDSTSGNTGVAYSWICAALGYRCALVMPANVSQVRKRIARAFGAELVFSDPLEGSDGAIRKAREMVERHPARYFYPDQYSNPSNPDSHEAGTAVEIWEALAGSIAVFAAGIGTGGTVMGTSRGLKARRPEVRCYAIEPAEPLHGLEGLKHMASSIVPAIYREEELDGKISVTTEEGWEMAERLGREEGLRVGHSSGAAVEGALRLARELAERRGEGNVVTVLPDRADRYFEPRRWERKSEW